MAMEKTASKSGMPAAASDAGDLPWRLVQAPGVGELRQRGGRGHPAQARDKWNPLVMDGKVLQFQMGDKGEYPVGLCDFYASALTSAELDEPFLEIFMAQMLHLVMQLQM